MFWICNWPPKVEALSALPLGSIFLISEDLYRKVTLEGETPAEGKIFALRFRDGEVLELADSDGPPSQCHPCPSGGGRIDAPVQYTLGDSASLDLTLGDLSSGGLFSVGGSAVPSMKATCALHPPPEGQGWSHDFETTSVALLALTTGARKIPATRGVFIPC